MYYGCDSNSDAVCNGQTLQLYLGELSGAFNSNAAQAASKNGGKAYGYWFLLGPTDDPNYDGTQTEAYNWGIAQGKNAISAWLNNNDVYGSTLFGDVRLPRKRKSMAG